MTPDAERIMYRGFTLQCPEGATPELRLAPIDGPRNHRPSLVSLAQDAATRTTAVLLGRIHYRKDLLARFPQLATPHDRSDAALALAAYRHLGRKGLEQLEGEFSLVVWDGKRQCLLAQRDPLGCWPLFWSVRNETRVVGTGLGALVDGQAHSAFDLDALAEFLMQPMPADELPCEQTAFQGIQRVLPGTIVELGPQGRVTRHAYWDWADRIGRTEAASLEDAGEQFATRLRQAVRERIPAEGSLAAHLSGGMDSSSVVCLAREAIAAGGGASPLHTLSLVHQRRSLAREKSFIDLVVSQGGPIRPQFLAADEVVYFDWFDEELPRHDEPSALLRSMPNHRCLVNAADRVGALMTLSGEGSDEIACFQPYHLADKVRRGRWWSALSEARQWSSGRNRGMWSVLRRYGLEPLFPLWFREGWGPSMRQGYGAWPGLSFFSVPPWVRPEFARKHGMRQRGDANARRMFAAPTDVSWNRFMLATTSGDWERWHLAAPLGMNLSHPFRDPRVVCFALGLPHHLRGVPGTTKPILETAMRGVLPEEIRTKQCSPGFDDMYGLGLRKNMARLEQLVRNPALADLGIVDAEKLIPVLHQAALGIGDAQATDRLDKTLTLSAWVDHMARRRPAEPSEVHRLEGDRAGRELVASPSPG